jgi:ABC-type transporter MlaC component
MPRHAASTRRSLTRSPCCATRRSTAPSGEPVRVDWRVRATPAGPRIVDVVVAGVRMVLTRRSELVAIIGRECGVPGSMAHLRRQVELAGRRAG